MTLLPYIDGQRRMQFISWRGLKLPDVTTWHEPLPDKCPPEEACRPDGDVFFRLVANFPPYERDFLSQRALAPKRKFRTVNECQAHSISLFDDEQLCAGLRALPGFQQKQLMVEIKLPDDAGVINSTGTKGHYSWWRSKDFDPVPYCSLVKSVGT